MFFEGKRKTSTLFVSSRLLLRSLAAALIAGLSCGCSHSIGESRIADDATVSDVRPGVSAKADVVKILGPPDDTQYFPSGEERWNYSYAQQHIEPEELGTDVVESIGLTILFGDNGLVRDVTEDRYRHTPRDMQHLRSSSRTVTPKGGTVP